MSYEYTARSTGRKAGAVGKGTAGLFADLGNNLMGGGQSYGASNNQQQYQQPQKPFVPHPHVPGLSANFEPFHNVEPRSRETRRAQTDKETLEKQRLKSRTGGFHKYDECQTIVGYDESAPGFQSEAARFDTDAAGEEFRQRQANMQTAHTKFDRKRQQNLDKDEARWQQMDQGLQAEGAKWERYRDEVAFGKKNVGSVPYNAITLSYNDGKDGQELQFQDEVVRYRAALRAQRLQEMGIGDGINPLTGKPVMRSHVPPEPTRPEVLQGTVGMSRWDPNANGM